MFKFEDNDDKVFCIKDSNVELSATFETLPKDLDTITIEWTRDGKAITNSEKFKVTKTKNAIQLAIQHVQRDDAGHYKLYAKTDSGETAEKDIELLVEDRSFGDNPPTFLRRLNDLAVKVGTRTRLLVEIRSATDVRVTWYRNDRRICENDRINFVNEGSFYCLEISSITLDDGGKWMCMAENLGGRNSCLATLNVLVPKAYKAPEFVEELRAILTEQGTVSLECKVVGVPTPVLRWFKDSKEIKAGDVFALTANPDDLTSLGTYTCEAVNCMGKTYSSSKLHISGKTSRESSLQPPGKSHGPPPIFTSELKNIRSKINDTITLGCQVMVPPWPKSVTWYNKDGKIEPSEKYKFVEDGLGSYILEIKPAEFTDEGEWKFVVTSTEGTVSISTCFVHMDIPKNYRKPRFMENLKAILTDEGLVSFECKVVGFPTPLLRWFKDGHELKPGDVYQLTGTNSLGSYSCIARNCMGEASSSAVLTLEDIQNQLNENERIELQQKNQPPKFLKGLMSSETKINEEFKFIVHVKATSEPVFSWFRDDLPIDKTNDRYEITTEKVGFCNLLIKCVEFVDQAEWKCVATNEFGHSTSTCFLKLQIPRHYKKPRFLECLRAVLTEEGAVNLECKVIGVPQPTLRWFKDGVELKPGDIHRIISGKDGECSLGTYTCEAKNCMGIVTSSATLLGYEENYKNVPKPEPANILQRHLSLSTIHEERTSQLYDTPMGGDITVDEEKGDVSFSFDGKEVSVSLYETPDLTEEEALQIVEMYADQISEHVTEQNIVELPPLRFVKETTQSGNLLMEAVVIDVSPDYFPPEEDMRTEADMEDISVVDPLSDQLSSSSSKRRRKEESMKSGGEVEEFFSLSQSKQTKNLSVLENYIVEEAHSDEEITETDLQTFESAKSSQKDSESKKRVIKSDDSMQEPPKLPPRKKPATDSKSKDEDSVYLQDISGEQGDGLKTQTKKSRTDTKTITINKSIIEKVTRHVIIVKHHLIAVENEVINQSTMMMSPASADSSIGIIKSVLEPINAIESKVNDYNGEHSVESLVENLLHDLKNLNHGLSIIEKCVEMDAEGKTLVQRTSVCVIESVGEQMLSFLESLKQVCLTNVQGSLQNESLLIINDMQTGIHITEDTIKSQTLMQEASALEASQRVSESVAQMQQMPETVPLEVVTTTELPKEANSFKLLCRYILKFQEVLESSQQSDIKKETLVEIQKPIVAIQNEIHTIEEKISKNSLKDTLEEKISFKILDTVSPPLYELNKCFEAISKSIDDGNQSPKLLDSFILPLQEIQNGLALIGHEIDSGFITKESPVDTEDNQKMVKTVAQNLIYFESNIENVRERTSVTVYDSLIQLKVTMQSMIEKIIREPLTKGSLQIINAFKLPLEELNYCFRHIEERMATNSLRDLLDPLNSLRENVEVVEEKLRHKRISGHSEDLKKVKDLVDQCDAEIQLFDIIQLDYQERMNQQKLIEQQLSEQSQQLSEFERSMMAQEQCDVLTNVQQNIINIQEIIGFEHDKSFSEHLSTLKTLASPLQDLSRRIANIREEMLLEHVNDISINDYKTILKLAKPLKEIYQQLAVITKQSTFESVQVFSSRSQQDILKTLATPLAELRNCIAAIQHECITMHEIQGKIEHPQISLKTAQPLEELRMRVEEIIHNIVEADEISATLDDVSIMKTTSEMSDVVVVKETVEKNEKTEEKSKADETKIEKVFEIIEEKSKLEEKSQTEVDRIITQTKQEIETVMIAILQLEKPSNEIKAVGDELNKTIENLEKLPTNINEINKLIITIEMAQKSLANKNTSDLILVKYNLESLKKVLYELRKFVYPDAIPIEIIESKPQTAETQELPKIDEKQTETKNQEFSKVESISKSEETSKQVEISEEKIVSETKETSTEQPVMKTCKIEEISLKPDEIQSTLTKEIKITQILIKKLPTMPELQALEQQLTYTLENITTIASNKSELQKAIEIIEIAEKKLSAQKSTQMIEIKDNLNSLKEILIILKATAKVQQVETTDLAKAQVGDVQIIESTKEEQIEIKPEVKEELKIIEEISKPIEETKPTEELLKIIEEPQQQIVHAVQSKSPEILQCLEKTKEEIENATTAIKKARRPTNELTTAQTELTTTLEKISELPENQQQIQNVIETIEKAETSLAAKKTTDIVLVKGYLDTLKQSLVLLNNVIKSQKGEMKEIDSKPQIAEVGVINDKSELKITEINEKVVDESIKEESKISESEKSQEIIEEKKVEENIVEKPKEEVKLESIEVEKPTEQIVSSTDITEIEKCVAKSKDEIEHTIESIKKVRRTTPEMQAIERQLSVTFEHANELPNNEKQITEIINSIESAEASIATRKTSDIAVVKGNFAALKQSLITLRNVIIEQKAKITSIDVQPQQAEIDIIETKDELKIVESTENISEETKDETKVKIEIPKAENDTTDRSSEVISEEVKKNEAVVSEKSNEVIDKTDGKVEQKESQEVIEAVKETELDSQTKSEEAAEIEKCVAKSKDEIEHTIESIKKVRRTTPEMQAIERQLSVTFEHANELPNNDKQITEIISSIESAEASISTRKTSDIAVVRQNLESLKQSLIVLRNIIVQHKPLITSIDAQPQQAQVEILETKDDLKIVESNEDISQVIQEETKIEVEKPKDETSVNETAKKPKEISTEETKLKEPVLEEKSQKAVKDKNDEQKVIESPKEEILKIVESSETQPVSEEKISEISEIEKCIAKTKDEIEHTIESIKKVKRTTPEMQAIERQLSVTFEHANELPNNENQITEIINSIESAEASISTRKTSDIAVVKGNFAALKQSLITLRNVIIEQKAKITSIDVQPHKAEIDIIETKDELKIVESTENISEETKDETKVVDQIESQEVIEAVKETELDSQTKSEEAAEIEKCVAKSKDEIEHTIESIKKVKRTTPEMQAIERQLSVTFEHANELPNNEKQIVDILNSIESAEASISTRKTSDIAVVRQNLETLKQSLVFLRNAIVQHKPLITSIDAQPQQAQVEILETKDDLKIVESNEDISQVIQEETKIEVEKPKDETSVNETAKKPKEISTEETKLKEPVLEEKSQEAVKDKNDEQKVIESPKEEILKIVESSETQPVSEEKISEISEIEKCIAKSKDEIEHTIESIKKVRRTTPEIQAIERQLSVTFEHANELPNNEKQITEIINSIESAEASISTRKTSDIAVVKGNFAALKQSLITLRNVIIEQKAKITSIDVQPHKAEIDIIETKDELKIVESTENISEETKDETKVVEEQKVDESISKQIAKPKDTEKQEIIQPQTAILESVPDFDKQILKAKEEIENVILSIKNVRRSTSELEAAQKQINIVLENITNLTENQQQIQKAIETVESAELSIATRKTGDILLVKNNLSNLKQSINVLNNAVQAQKSEVKDIEKKKQIADLSIIETPEELKIVESNESIATLIEEQKDELKIVESNENLAIKEAKAKEIVSESKDEKLFETPKFDEILVEQPKSEKIVEEPKVQEQVIEKPKIEEKPEKPIEQLIIEEPKVTDLITEEKQSEQLKVNEKPAIETTKIDEILTSEQLKPQEEINVEFCIKKSKSEIESAMASIKSVRRPTTELQATESDLKITLENITNLPDDKAQISKAIESIEKAEASLSIRKTSDVMLVKENLKSLKQSLELLKNTDESQNSQMTEISPTKQIADLSIIESSEDLKIVESNEDISSVSEEGKFIKPLDLPSEPKSPTEVCLEKSKSDMEITVESIKKARKPTTELQAVERQISKTLEHLSELPNDENKIQKVIESIQNAESSLTAKKTSDIVLVKENLKTLKESLTLLKTTITPQELKITEISQPETKIADLQIIEPKDDELKIIESNESLVSNEQSAEITLNLSKSREEIENVMFAIKKSRHPPSEVSAVEKTLTSTYEQLFELPKDEKPLEKAIESIEIAEISLITRGASELMIIKENLGTLKHSLVKLISHINPDKAKAMMTELQKPQNIQEEIKIDESNELKITESNEELKIIEQEQPKKEELPMIVTSIQKLESQIESAIDSIKKSHRPTPELQAVEKEFSFTIEHIKELDNDKQQIEKVIEVIENAESSLIAKRTSDIVLIKENLALVKETLNVLKVTAKSKPIEVVEITHDKPQQALSEELNKGDDKKLIIEEIAKKEEEKLPEISLNENVKKIKSEIDITIESIKKVRRPISEIQAVERDLTFTIEQVNNLPNDQIKLAKVIETIETAETALVTKKTSDVMLVKSNLSDLKKSLILMKVEEPKKSEITETKIPSEPQKAEIEEKSVDQKQKEEIKATVQPKDEQKVEEVKDESKIDEKAKEEAKVEEKSNEELQAEQQPKMEKKEEKLPQNLQELKSDIENSIQSIKKTKRPVPEAEAVEKILSVANENVTEFSANEKELQKAIESITSAEAALVAKKTSDFVLIKKNIVALKEKLVTIHNKLMPQQPEIKEQEIIPEKAKIEETIVEKDKVEEQKDEKPKTAPSFDESQKAIEEKPQIELSPDLKILKSEIATSVDIIKKARRPTSEVEAVEKILSFAIENITEFSTNDVKIQNAIESIATAETSLTSRKTSDIMLVKSNFGELKEKLITIYNKLKPPQQVEVKEIEKPKEALVEEKSSEKSEKEIPKVVEEKLSPELTKLKSEISTTIESIKKVRRLTTELESIQNELKIVLENVTFIPENQEKLQKLIVSIENTETSLSAKKTSDINIVKDCLKSLKSSLNVFKVETKESKIEELPEPQKSETNEASKEDEKLSKVEENKESQKIVEESKAVEETESEKIKLKIDEKIKSKDESKLKVDETAIVIKIRKQIENTSATIKKVRRPTPELQTADAELTIVLGKLPEFENDINHVEKVIKIISSAEDSIITKKTTDVTAVKDSFIILKKTLVELKDSKKSNEVVEIKEEFKPQEIEKPKEEEKKEPSPEPVVTIKLNDNARKLKSEIENVTETIKKVRRPTSEIQTLEKTLNDSLNVKILVEIPENLTKLNEILKSVETCEESLMTKKTSDITLFKTSLSSMKECVKVLRAPLLPKEEQKIEEKPQEEKKIEESPKTDEKPKEEEKIEEAPKTEEKPKEEEKKEPSPEPVVSIKLNDNARKLKSEIENVTETIKKVRRPTSEIQALEKTLNESLNVKILVEIPENLTKLNEILKSVETCEESLMTKKTSDITLLKTSLSSMKELVKVLRTPLLPKEEQTIEEKPQEEKKIEEAPKTDEKLNKEPQKSEQQESKLIFEEKDLMSQYIAAIKQELEEVLVHLKKARRPSTELQTLHETLIDLKPKVDDLGKDMKYFENVIHIVNKSKTSLLTKRTMELILLREKVTSLENSLNLLKSTIVTEINGELFSTKKTESDDEILKKQKEAKEEIKLQEELKKQEEIRLKEEELRQKEEEFKKREQELKREEENRLKEEEARRKMLEEEILRKAKEKEAEKIKLQNENEPERPPRRRKQVDDSESQSTDSEMPIATERRRRQQQEIEPEPIKPVRRRRTDEIKEDEQSMPRTPESGRRKRMPTFIARLKNRSAAENSILKLTCAVSEPDCQVKWTKDGMILRNGDKYLIENNNEVLSLEIKNANAEDAGEYCCFVSNSCGEIETSAFVTIFGEDIVPNSTVFTKNLKGELKILFITFWVLKNISKLHKILFTFEFLHFEEIFQ